jgi:hypothetical protein
MDVELSFVVFLITLVIFLYVNEDTNEFARALCFILLIVEGSLAASDTPDLIAFIVLIIFIILLLYLQKIKEWRTLQRRKKQKR